MTFLRDVSVVKNYTQRPGDTFLRENAAKILKKLGVKDGTSSQIAAAILSTAQQIQSFLTEPKQRYNQLLDLPTRGSIVVNYDGPEGQPDGNVVFIPFYENPEIKEENSANYTTRHIFGRNSPLRNFTYAGPRKFSIKIPYTLEHLAAFDYSRIYKHIDFSTRVNRSLKAYQKEILGSDENKAAVRRNEGLLGNFERQAEKFIDKYGRIELTPGGIKKKINQLFGEDPPNRAPQLLGAYFSILEIVRSLVLTSNEQPWKKPPVIKIKMGDWLDNIQCIVTNYSIEDVGIGYDVNTLLPRRINYILTVEEFVSLPTGKTAANSTFYNLPSSDAIIRNIQMVKEREEFLKTPAGGKQLGPVDPPNPNNDFYPDLRPRSPI